MRKVLMVIFVLVMALTLVIGSVSTVSAAPNRDYGNYKYLTKHYYLFVYVPGLISWNSAKVAAYRQETINGIIYQGHLVAINSARENDFVNQISGGEVIWIGAEQPPDQESSSTGWHWVTGERLKYTNWSSGHNDIGQQPDDWYGNIAGATKYFEDNEENIAYSIDGGWFDGVRDSSCYYYVIEFEPLPKH